MMFFAMQDNRAIFNIVSTKPRAKWVLSQPPCGVSGQAAQPVPLA